MGGGAKFGESKKALLDQPLQSIGKVMQVRDLSTEALLYVEMCAENVATIDNHELAHVFLFVEKVGGRLMEVRSINMAGCTLGKALSAMKRYKLFTREEQRMFHDVILLNRNEMSHTLGREFKLQEKKLILDVCHRFLKKIKDEILPYMTSDVESLEEKIETHRSILIENGFYEKLYAKSRLQAPDLNGNSVANVTVNDKYLLPNHMQPEQDQSETHLVCDTETLAAMGKDVPDHMPMLRCSVKQKDVKVGNEPIYGANAKEAPMEVPEYKPQETAGSEQQDDLANQNDDDDSSEYTL